MMCKASNVCKVRNRQNDPQNECVCPSIPTPFYLKKNFMVCSVTESSCKIFNRICSFLLSTDRVNEARNQKSKIYITYYSYLIYVLPPPGIKIQKYLSNENHKIFILKRIPSSFLCRFVVTFFSSNQ